MAANAVTCAPDFLVAASGNDAGRPVLTPI
jgi:hypothetical protein